MSFPNATTESSTVNSFRPAWFLPGGHLQTLGGRFYRRNTPYNYERRIIETPDDDFLALDYADSIEQFERNQNGHVLLLHGLEGCSRSGYILTMVDELRSRDYASVVLNFRSCSGAPNRRPRFYHSGETADLKFVVNYLREQLDNPLTGIVGFSLGGNVLLKYLGENHDSYPLRRACAISVPYDLATGADKLRSGLSRFYERYFLNQLKNKVRQKEEAHRHGFDLSRLSDIQSLREFDDTFTAPIHDFESAEDYYRTASSVHYVESIGVPTRILQALDDPMVPADAVPLERFENNRWISATLTDRGGHVGFLEGSHPSDVTFWAESVAADFLTETASKKIQ